MQREEEEIKARGNNIRRFEVYCFPFLVGFFDVYGRGVLFEQ